MYKKYKRILRFCICILLTGIVSYVLILSDINSDVEFENRLAPGLYRLNIYKSDFVDYLKDSIVYKNLTISIDNEGTYSCNMDAPFIYKKKGFWQVKGYWGSPGTYSCLLYDASRNCQKSDVEFGSDYLLLRYPLSKTNYPRAELYFDRIYSQDTVPILIHLLDNAKK